MRLGPERKFPVSQDARFLISLGGDGYPSANPTLSIAFEAGTWTGELAPVRSADTVTAIADDRMRLTISTAGTQGAGIIGIPGDYAGEGWLVGPGGSLAVRGRRLVSDTAGAGVIELDRPLPRSFSILSAAATVLRWPLHYVVIPAATIGATPQRFRRWSLPWTRTQGASATAEILVEQGILHVVRSVFDTGLTEAHLRVFVPDMEPFASQDSWHLQRDAALDELVEWLRAGLQADQHEDMAPGHMFRAVHALLTGALIFDGFDAQGKPGAAADAERMRAQARERFDRIMSRITWLDLDEDGEADDAETDLQQRDLGGLARSSATNTALTDISDPDEAFTPDWVTVEGDR